MAAPAKVTRVGHIGLKVGNLSQHAAFYTDLWGLGITEESKGRLYLRAEEPTHHAMALYEAERDVNAIEHIGLEVRDRADLERAAEELARRGMEILQPPGPASEPGRGYTLRFRDPAGLIVELFAEPERVADDYGERAVKPTKISHIVINVPDPEAQAQFYCDVLGFRVIDRNAIGFRFMNCNSDHHSLAFVPGERTKLHHVAWEVKDWFEICKGMYHLGEHGVPRVWGPGRHGPGNNLFAYFLDRENNVMEYTAEVEQVDETYQPKDWSAAPHGQPDYWRVYPPPPYMPR
ncbi:MAG: VOC family protein [Chloroflexi bacterium]|jgi:catechol-2,3-dioxygenase|nr:VOC family protein [Chloroflexota bacterium]